MTQAICCGTTTTPTWKRGALTPKRWRVVVVEVPASDDGFVPCKIRLQDVARMVCVFWGARTQTLECYDILYVKCTVLK